MGKAPREEDPSLTPEVRAILHPKVGGLLGVTALLAGALLAGALLAWRVGLWQLWR